MVGVYRNWRDFATARSVLVTPFPRLSYEKCNALCIEMPDASLRALRAGCLSRGFSHNSLPYINVQGAIRREATASVGAVFARCALGASVEQPWATDSLKVTYEETNL